MLQAGYSVTIPDGFFHFIPTNAKTFLLGIFAKDCEELGNESGCVNDIVSRERSHIPFKGTLEDDFPHMWDMLLLWRVIFHPEM